MSGRAAEDIEPPWACSQTEVYRPQPTRTVVVPLRWPSFGSKPPFRDRHGARSLVQHLKRLHSRVVGEPSSAGLHRVSGRVAEAADWFDADARWQCSEGRWQQLGKPHESVDVVLEVRPRLGRVVEQAQVPGGVALFEEPTGRGLDARLAREDAGYRDASGTGRCVCAPIAL